MFETLSVAYCCMCVLILTLASFAPRSRHRRYKVPYYTSNCQAHGRPSHLKQNSLQELLKFSTQPLSTPPIGGGGSASGLVGVACRLSGGSKLNYTQVHTCLLGFKQTPSTRSPRQPKHKHQAFSSCPPSANPCTPRI